MSQRKAKQLATILGALQIFIGLGAVAGGLGLVLDPSGANLGIPLVPGVINNLRIDRGNIALASAESH